MRQAGQPEAAALFLSQGKDSPFAMRRDCIENQDDRIIQEKKLTSEDG